MKQVIIILSLMIMILSMAFAVQATDITVCENGCNHTTIQAAINAANPGDTIVVQDGTYTGNVDINTYNLTIRGEENVILLSNTTSGNMANSNPSIHIIEDKVTLTNLTVVSIENSNGVNKHAILIEGNDATLTNLDVQITNQNPSFVGIRNNNANNTLIKQVSITGGPIAGSVPSSATIKLFNNTIKQVGDESIWFSGNNYNLELENNYAPQGIKLTGVPTTFNGQPSGTEQEILTQIINSNEVEVVMVGSGEGNKNIQNIDQQLYYGTIQAAINAANPGDTIVVQDGTYTGNVDINVENLTVVSVNGFKYTIIIGGGQSGAGDATIRITANNVILQGFTVDNQNNQGGAISGGNNAANTTITENKLVNSQRGIRGDFHGRFGEGLTISHNIFSGVTRGIVNTENIPSIIVYNNTFKNIDANAVSFGPGIKAISIENNTFVNVTGRHVTIWSDVVVATNSSMQTILETNTFDKASGVGNASNAEFIVITSTITQAIEEATDNQTILVLEGTYTESLEILKNISLQAVGSVDNTIIDARGATNAIEIGEYTRNGIHPHNVKISGFTIINWTERGIGQRNGNTTMTITNNIIQAIEEGTRNNAIVISGGDGSLIHNNTVASFSWNNPNWSSSPVLLMGTTNAKVSENTISGADYCIGIVGAQNWASVDGNWVESKNTTIVNNTISKCDVAILVAGDVENTNITQNIITESYRGIYHHNGIYQGEPKNTIIELNTFNAVNQSIYLGDESEVQSIDRNRFVGTGLHLVDGRTTNNTIMLNDNFWNSTTRQIILDQIRADVVLETIYLNFALTEKGRFSTLGDLGTVVVEYAANETVEEVTSIVILAETILTTNMSEKIITARILANTTIQEEGQEPFNATRLTFTNISKETIANLEGTLRGVIQFGIPNTSLTFNQAIELQIYVGPGLSGQTLNVQRSTTGQGSWVNVANCEVTAQGYCNFITTQASYFVARTEPEPAPAPTTGGAGGGGSFTFGGTAPATTTTVNETEEVEEVVEETTEPVIEEETTITEEDVIIVDEEETGEETSVNPITGQVVGLNLGETTPAQRIVSLIVLGILLVGAVFYTYYRTSTVAGLSARAQKLHQKANDLQQKGKYREATEKRQKARKLQKKADNIGY